MQNEMMMMKRILCKSNCPRRASARMHSSKMMPFLVDVHCRQWILHHHHGTLWSSIDII